VRALVGRRLCLHKLNNILNQWQLQIGLGTIVRLAGRHAAKFSSGDVEAHDSFALHMPYVRSHLRLACRALLIHVVVVLGVIEDAIPMYTDTHFNSTWELQLK
jgi:hypothetical protein